MEVVAVLAISAISNRCIPQVVAVCVESVRGEIAALRRLPEDDRRKAFKMLCAQSAAPFDEV